MGAWGAGHFENDTALDWVYSLEESKDEKILWDAIEAVMSEEYVDSDVAVEALAALEVAAGLKGKHSANLPEEVEKWLSKNDTLKLPDNFYGRAKVAMNKIIGTDSELKDLWEESDSFDEWLAEVKDLHTRLSS